MNTRWMVVCAWLVAGGLFGGWAGLVSGASADEKTKLETIEASLREKTAAEFLETPLSDVMEFLAKTHGVSIVVDWRTLETLEITKDTPVTLKATDVSLRSALTLILRPFDCTFAARDDVIHVTTKPFDRLHPTLRVIKLGELWPDLSEEERFAAGGELLETMLQLYGDDSEDEHYIRAAQYRDVLLIRGGVDAHRGIEELFEKLRIKPNDGETPEPSSSGEGSAPPMARG